MSTIALPPDSARYLATDPPHPFHLRILLPAVCRQNLTRWRVATIIGTLLLCLSTAALAADWRQGVAAGLLVAALPIVRFNMTHPVLVDAAALGLAATSAALWVHGWHVAALVAVLLAGAAKESAPVFAALFAWHPLLLVGLIVPAIVASLRTPGADMLGEHHAWILKHPWQASRAYHADLARTLDPLWLMPWGGALTAIAAPTVQLLATVAVAYGQCLIATDTVRLYQWAAPVVAIAATTAVAPAWWPLLILLTVFNPARSDGS